MYIDYIFNKQLPKPKFLTQLVFLVIILFLTFLLSSSFSFTLIVTAITDYVFHERIFIFIFNKSSINLLKIEIQNDFDFVVLRFFFLWEIKEDEKRFRVYILEENTLFESL